MSGRYRGEREKFEFKGKRIPGSEFFGKDIAKIIKEEEERFKRKKKKRKKGTRIKKESYTHQEYKFSSSQIKQHSENSLLVSNFKKGASIFQGKKEYNKAIKTKLPIINNNSHKDKGLKDYVKGLLKSKIIEKVKKSKLKFAPRVFTIAKKDSYKRRLIYDARKLNSILKEPGKTRFPHGRIVLKKIKNWIKTFNWDTKKLHFTKIDLKDAYYHIPIENKSRNFLGIVVDGKAYRYKYLPFGLKSAPFIFSKTFNQDLAIFMKKRNPKKAQLIPYLDDLLIIGKNKYETSKITEDLAKFLTTLNWKINQEKSILSPMTRVEFVGFEITGEGIGPSKESWENLKMDYHSFLFERQKMRRSRIEEIQGNINFILSLYPSHCLLTRPISLEIKNRELKRNKWKEEKYLINLCSNYILKEILWMKRGPRMDWINNKKGNTVTSIITDGSIEGIGAIIDNNNNPWKRISICSLTPGPQQRNEALALLMATQNWPKRKKLDQIFADSQMLLFNIHYQKPSSKMLFFLLPLVKIIFKQKFTPDLFYIKSDQNPADWLSRELPLRYLIENRNKWIDNFDWFYDREK